ncbi:MAG: proline dehydrogenase family protein [bacterium]
MKVFNNLIVKILPIFPKSFIWLFSKRYIAGTTLQDAMDTTRELNDEGCYSTIDVLGEEVMTREETIQSRDLSIQVLKALHENKLKGSLSVKLTSLGLRFDKDLCYENVKTVVKEAKKKDYFVRIDMEDATCTDDTLEIYRRLRKDFTNVGAVIQAYMKRSVDDVKKLIDDGIANLRVCKGIYNESPEIAYKDFDKIRENFLEIIKLMLESKSYTGIATHDTYLIEKSQELISKTGSDPSYFEFQMLLGVTEKTRAQLVEEGKLMRVYVPFGEDWYGYCTRRLKENPKMAGHIIKNLFVRK